MRRPHRCPVCEGSGCYVGAPGSSVAVSVIPTRASHPCHACDASGVVWEPAELDPPAQPFVPYTVSTGTTATPYSTTWHVLPNQGDEPDAPAAVPA